MRDNKLLEYNTENPKITENPKEIKGPCGSKEKI